MMILLIATTPRHNQLNVAGTYQQHYGLLLKDDSEIKHFAHSAAILSGDLLISDAYQLIINSSLSATQRLKSAELLGEAIYAVSAGALQISGGYKAGLGIEQLDRQIQHKLLRLAARPILSAGWRKGCC